MDRAAKSGVVGEGDEALDNLLPTGQMLQAVSGPVPK